MNEEKYTYKGKFEGNILIVGQTECIKVTFVQKLAINNVFEKLKEVQWISTTELTKTREAEIEYCFDSTASFSYPNDIREIDEALCHIKKII